MKRIVGNGRPPMALSAIVMTVYPAMTAAPVSRAPRVSHRSVPQMVAKTKYTKNGLVGPSLKCMNTAKTARSTTCTATDTAWVVLRLFHIKRARPAE
jgi:hypothetical protein